MKAKQNGKVLYCNELIDSNGYIYSVDMLRIDLYIDNKKRESFLKYMGSFRTDIIHRENYEHFKFKHLWTIYYDKNVSMTIGFCFNGNDHYTDMVKGFIDVNPNKAGLYKQFWKDFNKIKSFCNYFYVNRCDIALDIPTRRSNLFLIKNNKKYTQISHSHYDKSEYLGCRSTVGFVKLYNKTAESKLDYELSRLEITCLLNPESYKKHFPKIYDVSNKEIKDEMDKLNDTERAIVEMSTKLILSGDDDAFMIFNSMGRVMKAKLKNIILSENKMITYSEEVLEQLMENAQELYAQ